MTETIENDMLPVNQDSEVKDSPPMSRQNGIIAGLADLSPKTLLNEHAMASIFAVSQRTIRRMVVRFELPPPVALAGRSTWVAERVLDHIEARAEKAARKAEQESRRIEALPYAL